MRKTSEEAREMAKAHADYTMTLIRKCAVVEISTADFVNLTEYLYIEAMVHGYKHAINDMEAERRAEIES